jgi:hypothetical protein
VVAEAIHTFNSSIQGRGRGAEGQRGRGAEGQRGRGAEAQRGRGAEAGGSLSSEPAWPTE